jgi:hypothetical protein
MGRPPEYPRWMAESGVCIKPLKPAEVLETVAAIKDAQADIATHFGVLLRSPSSAAMERLVEARQRERELFELILDQDIPVWQRKADRRCSPRRTEKRVEGYSNEILQG